MMKPLLIPLTYFCLHTWLGIPQAKCQVELSMMDDAFDDQYLACAEEMDGIAPGLLEKEKSMSSLFSRVWENSEKKWELVKKKISLPTGFKDEHGRAIIAYTDNDFHREKNQMCVDNSATRGGIAFPSVLSHLLFGGSIILVHVAALKRFAGFSIVIFVLLTFSL
ncbi:ecto-ADP-ribosyltransferase 5-like isoform X3 [Lepidochelys kempii]|uniref:ecto-ADP-ribosyltransferase 5-like isoform X3 n=1 Tax=Lepidochelys kempii TaxID=8472 RepID=UPI003C6F41E5